VSLLPLYYHKHKNNATITFTNSFGGAEMTITYSSEKERMRATNLQLLRAILEADTLAEENHN